MENVNENIAGVSEDRYKDLIPQKENKSKKSDWQETAKEILEIKGYYDKEQLNKYTEVSVAEILNNYTYYVGEEVCAVGYVSTSLVDDEQEYLTNVIFLVDNKEQILTKGTLPMIPYADETVEYDRASKFENIIIPNHGENVTIIDAGEMVKVYGKVDYSAQFNRVGITPLKIEVIN